MLHLTPFLTAYFTVLAFVLGTVLASFLGCLGWRMCHGESVFKGRSHCDSCGHTLGVKDLIPILSYVSTKGRCRYCGATIPKLNLYGELILGIIFAVLTYLTADPYSLSWKLIFVSVLYLVSVTDIYEQIIPDGALLVAILVRIIYVIFGAQSFTFSEFIWLLVDGLALSLPLLLLVLLMEKIWKKEAMGGGDIKLIFVTGLYLGWIHNFLVLLLACIVGIIIGLIQQKNTIDTEGEEDTFYFPFGPSIAISAVFVLLFGDGIINWYLSLL